MPGAGCSGLAWSSLQGHSDSPASWIPQLGNQTVPCQPAAAAPWLHSLPLPSLQLQLCEVRARRESTGPSPKAHEVGAMGAPQPCTPASWCLPGTSPAAWGYLSNECVFKLLVATGWPHKQTTLPFPAARPGNSQGGGDRKPSCLQHSPLMPRLAFVGSFMSLHPEPHKARVQPRCPAGAEHGTGSQALGRGALANV